VLRFLFVATPRVLYLAAVRKQILLVTGPRSPGRLVRRFRELAGEVKLLELPSPGELRAALQAGGERLVVLFGGDGTLNRHLAALVESQACVLLVPTGSGNDFARALGIRSGEQALELFRDFLDGTAHQLRCDLGLARFSDGTERFFSCCLNVGLDADAARRTNALPDWMKARGGYFWGGLAALMRYQPEVISLSGHGVPRHAAKSWFVTVSNTPTFGGGLPIAPNATVDDGLLYVTVVHGLGRAALAWHYPKILRGRHTALPQVMTFKIPGLKISTPRPQAIYGDGEALGQTPVEVSVLPAALPFLNRQVT